HFVRTIPGTGLIVAHGRDEAIKRVLARGCWTPVEPFASEQGWNCSPQSADGCFEVAWQSKALGKVSWELLGEHNQHNALAALAAARHVGVPPAQAIAALAEFKNVKRRMEVRAVIKGITLYDDFAHHPTAITTTLAGLRRRVGEARIIAVLEPRSNTMRMGVHQHTLAPALGLADSVVLYLPKNLGWDLSTVAVALGSKAQVFDSTQALANYLANSTCAGDHIIIMSNGSFDGLHEQLISALQIQQS
ncbi:MAG: cyanophycin synthetase, partial [Gammaproteobacteria bacterium]